MEKALRFGISLPIMPGNKSSSLDIEFLYQHGRSRQIGEGFYSVNHRLQNPGSEINNDIIRPIKLSYALKISLGMSFRL